MTKEKALTSNVTQTIDSHQRERLAYLAKSLGLAQSRVLNLLLTRASLADLMAMAGEEATTENANGMTDIKEVLSEFTEKASASIIRNVSVGLEARLKESIERAAMVGVGNYFRDGGK